MFLLDMNIGAIGYLAARAIDPLVAADVRRLTINSSARDLSPRAEMNKSLVTSAATPSRTCRLFMLLSLVVTFSLVAASTPRNISNHRELFVDRFLIDSMKGTQLALHEPRDEGIA